MFKTCSKCKRDLPVAEFVRDASTKSGLYPSCLACMKARKAKYYAENAEKVKARKAKYYAENAEVVKARNAKRRAENPDKGVRHAAFYRARRRGVPCTITVRDVYVLRLEAMLRGCVLKGPDCAARDGGGLDFENRADHPNSAQLDCHDPPRGYVPGNCGFACRTCNLSKNDVPLSEIAGVKRRHAEEWAKSADRVWRRK